MLECIAHWIKDFPPSQEQQSTLRNLNEMLAEVQDKHGEYKESHLVCTWKIVDVTAKHVGFGHNLCPKIALHT